MKIISEPELNNKNEINIEEDSLKQLYNQYHLNKSEMKSIIKKADIVHDKRIRQRYNLLKQENMEIVEVLSEEGIKI